MGKISNMCMTSSHWLLIQRKNGGTEYVQSIKFTSKRQRPKKESRLEAKKKTMKKKYGRARDNFGVYTYKKGKMGITFTVDDGKVSAIQYVAY